MPAMTVPSAAMRRLRRELEAGRMRGALAPAGGVAKKPSRPPLCPAPTPARRAVGDTKSDCARALPLVASPCSRRAETKHSCASFGKGAQVRVRTPVATLRAGQRLVLWLGAVVVSAAEEEGDGFLGVVYTHYKHPCSDPSGTVRVSKKDVKDMLPPLAAAIGAAAPAGSSTVTVGHTARPPLQVEAAVPVRRPTTAGKRPSLLKKMEKEMRSKSEAILAPW